MTTSMFKSGLLKLLVPGFILMSAFVNESKAGGITFEIYLNNQLLLKQRYNKIEAGSPDLQFTAANYNDNLRIFFRSCGTSSKTRSVGVKNENNEVLKKWDFENSSSTDLSMTIPVKEILSLQKSKPGAALRLFYFSPDQFQDGYMLASLLTAKKNTAFNSNRSSNYWSVFTAGILALGVIGRFTRRADLPK